MLSVAEKTAVAGAVAYLCDLGVSLCPYRRRGRNNSVTSVPSVAKRRRRYRRGRKYIRAYPCYPWQKNSRSRGRSLPL